MALHLLVGIINLDLEVVKPTQKTLRPSSLEGVLRMYREGNGFLLLPPVVSLNEDHYLIVDGHHRLAVAKYLGYENIAFYEINYCENRINPNLFSDCMSEAIEESNSTLIKRGFGKVIKDRSLVRSRGIINIENMYGYSRLKEIESLVAA